MSDQRLPADVPRIEICSYRTVFDLERRIYRVDRMRLNPQGIPIRGLVYALALLAASAAFTSLPGLGLALRVLPWYVREGAIPICLAALLTLLRIDGRTIHVAVVAFARMAWGPRRLCSLRRAPALRSLAPPDLLMLPDGSDAQPRRLRYSGPGAVLIAGPHERIHTGGLLRLLRRADVVLRQPRSASGRDRAQVIEIAPGTRAETRPGSLPWLW